ncbi:MAG TPA: MEDS domain-containing protein [Candidatus Tectomicrobia bacterium]|nr:MEDS domain-containing protein [Candidatus Tectomicrobia bacterium]
MECCVDAHGLERQLAELSYGAPRCLVYEERHEQLAAVVPFLAQRPRAGARCLYVVDETTGAEALQALAAAGVDVEAEQSRGALVLLTKRETYLRTGVFAPDAMIAFLDATHEAIGDGFNGLRVTGEMTWALGRAPGQTAGSSTRGA